MSKLLFIKLFVLVIVLQTLSEIQSYLKKTGQRSLVPENYQMIYRGNYRIKCLDFGNVGNWVGN